MTTLALFLAILGAILLGAMSPGPSFVLVSRIAVSGSRRSGLAAALGMGLGGAVFALLALLGLTALLERVEALHVLLRLCGGLYLLWLGIGIWRQADAPLTSGPLPQDAARDAAPRAFRLGLTTQLANPKTAVVYAGIFAALLPGDPPRALLLALPLAVFCVEAGWYALVALLLSAPGPGRAYRRGKRLLDRIAGAVLGGLGLRLILEGLRQP